MNNAATSWPKPEEVGEAMAKAVRRLPEPPTGEESRM